MRPDALAEAIDARPRATGVTPIAVVATAGTTLTGAIDPLDAIADVCAARGVWLHVDGAYGLPAAAAASRADAVRGLARADSCSVDAHKWLYLPKACGVVLVRDGDALAAAFAHEQGYLPHQQHELHAVDITLEYSRPFRALKLWLAFRAHGAAQFRDAIERNLAEARPAVPTQVAGDARTSRSLGGAAAAVDRAVPPRAGRASPTSTRTTSALADGDPGGRPGLPVVRADRRRGVAAPVLRELPHDGGRRAGPARRRP